MSAVRYRKKIRTCMELSASLWMSFISTRATILIRGIPLTRLSSALSTISLTRRRRRRWNAPASRTTHYSFTATRAAEKRISYKPSVIILRSSTRDEKYFILPLKNSLSIIPTRCRKGPRTALKINIVNMTFSLWTMYNSFLKRKDPRRTLPSLQHTSRYEQTNCFFIRSCARRHSRHCRTSQRPTREWYGGGYR